MTRDTLHVTGCTSRVARHGLHVTRHPSAPILFSISSAIPPPQRMASNDFSRHMRNVNDNTSLVTRHTSHVTRHTSHVTHHTSNGWPKRNPTGQSAALMCTRARLERSRVCQQEATAVAMMVHTCWLTHPTLQQHCACCPAHSVTYHMSNITRHTPHVESESHTSRVTHPPP